MSFVIIAAAGVLFAAIVPVPMAAWTWFAFWMSLAVMDFWAKLDKHLTQLQLSNEWMKLYHQKMLMETHPERAQAILQTIHKVLDPNWIPPEIRAAQQANAEPPRPPKPAFKAEVVPEYPETPTKTKRPKPPQL